MVFMAGMNVAGSSIRAGETNTGIDWYFTVLTLEERRGQGKAKKKKINSIFNIFSRDNFTTQTKTIRPKDAFKSLHSEHFITQSL